MMTSRYFGMIYLFFIMVIGLIFGTVYVQMLPHAVMSDLLEQWSVIFNGSSEIASSQDTLVTYFLYQLRLAICMLVIGVTIVGYPIALLIQFLKAFLIGSTIQLFYVFWGDEALQYILIWIAPSAIFILIGFFILSAALASYSYACIQAIKQHAWHAPLTRLCKLSLLSCLFILIGSLSHTYLSPYLATLFIATT